MTIYSDIGSRVYLAKRRELLALQRLRIKQRYPQLMTMEFERRLSQSMAIIDERWVKTGKRRSDRQIAIRIVTYPEILCRKKIINSTQLLAAQMFCDEFEAAGLAGIKAIDFSKDVVDVSTKSDDMAVARMVEIQRYVKAMVHVPRASWRIIRMVLLEGGRLPNVRVVQNRRNQGIRNNKVKKFLHGLDALVAHYGLKPLRTGRFPHVNGSRR